MTERTESLALENLHCASCAQEIEDTLCKMQGIHEAQVFFGSSKVEVKFDSTKLGHDELVKSLEQLGHRVAHPEVPSTPWWKQLEVLLTAISGAFLFIGLFTQFLTSDALIAQFGWWDIHLSSFFYLAAVGFGGAQVTKAGLNAILEKHLGINGLMSLAIIGAVVIGEFVEAASLAFLYALAEILEQYVVDRARNSLRELLKLAPQEATILINGQPQVVSVDGIDVGQTLLVRAGEKVPLDGTVISGQSTVNQAPITGEAMPIDKTAGDVVYAGSLNESGVLHVRVDKAAKETTLAKIIHLVEKAEAQKAPTERFVEKFGRIYTPVVVGLAVLVAVIPTLFFAQPFVDWFLRAITLLVISCPCALLISTPVSVVSAITAAARNGVLIKGGAYLESIGQANVIALDKTGTLTTGRLEVQEVVSLNGASENDILTIAASLERASHHPIAQAIVRSANGSELVPVQNFHSITGKGVEGVLNGQHYRLGKLSLFQNADLDVFHQLEDETKSVVVVGTQTEAIGLISVRDQIRPQAKAAIESLQKLGIEMVMITGDHDAIAQNVAQQLGINHYHAGVLPEQKLELVKQLQQQHGHVVMVGDGINDAPALALANVGIAMGAVGSDTALETADIALLSDDLSKLPYLIRLSRQARRVIQQNIGTSIFIKVALSLGVIPGWVTLVAAVLIGDMGTTLAVTGNAMRLARLKPPKAVDA